MNHDDLLATASQLLTLGLIARLDDLALLEGEALAVARPAEGHGITPARYSMAHLAPAAWTADSPSRQAALASLRRSAPNRVILLSSGPYTRIAAVAARGTLRPALDDLAQLVGPRLLRRALPTGGRRLKADSAVLVPGLGCLCLATDCYEALALAMVVEKACLADFVGRLFDSPHPISRGESLLMRLIYRAKYRKAAQA